MDIQSAVDLGRDALNVSLLVGAPMLVVALVVGLTVGLVQALMQIQEQTVAFVPKLVAVAVAASMMLPWAIGQMCVYVQDLYVQIPDRL
jgi:flagellar biosynthetic protein FliQ